MMSIIIQRNINCINETIYDKRTRAKRRFQATNVNVIAQQLCYELIKIPSTRICGLPLRYIFRYRYDAKSYWHPINSCTTLSLAWLNIHVSSIPHRDRPTVAASSERHAWAEQLCYRNHHTPPPTCTETLRWHNSSSRCRSASARTPASAIHLSR